METYSINLTQDQDETLCHGCIKCRVECGCVTYKLNDDMQAECVEKVEGE